MTYVLISKIRRQYALLILGHGVIRDPAKVGFIWEPAGYKKYKQIYPCPEEFQLSAC